MDGHPTKKAADTNGCTLVAAVLVLEESKALFGWRNGQGYLLVPVLLEPLNDVDGRGKARWGKHAKAKLEMMKAMVTEKSELKRQNEIRGHQVVEICILNEKERKQIGRKDGQ